MKPRLIKGARAGLGYKQSFMAEQLDMSIESYRKKEGGSGRFSFEQKLKLARILKMPFDSMNDILFDGKLPTPDNWNAQL